MSLQKLSFFALVTLAVFGLDQYIKYLILEGLRWDSSCLSITYTLNTGVAFSMFAFLGEYLKFIQLGVILFGLGYVIYEKLIVRYWLPVAILLGAALANVLDRFVHGGVVDYVYWHCGFDFAIFNFADVMIDVAVVLILFIHFKIFPFNKYAS